METLVVFFIAMCFHLPDYSYYLDIQVESYEEHCLLISMVDFGVCLVHVF